MKHGSNLLSIVCKTLHDVSSSGIERWTALRSAALQFFGTDQLFLCIFDGRYMIYTPTEVKDCVSGSAYNYRETVKGSKDNANSKFNLSLYKELGLECDHSLAFPYRANGRVAGAIEVINPKFDNVSDEEQKLFSNLTACLISNMPNK